MKFQYYLKEPLFRVGDIDVQSVSRPKNYKHSFKNGREKHGFICVTCGQIAYSFEPSNSERVILSKGEMIFIPKGKIYTGEYLGDDTKIKIVQFDLIQGDLPTYLSNPVVIRMPNACETVEAFFGTSQNHFVQHPFYCLSCLYELLWRIDEIYSKIPKKYKKLQTALNEISKNWDKNEKISHYAQMCNMSEANFRRLFKEYTKMSPVDYRNEIRLQNARKKIQSGEYNVSEAAYESGFTNLSFFIRLYKKKYGYTPKKE